jgi:ATP-dependent helicase/nuclease subunit B
LPYLASWPALRDGYLEWLKAHEANGFSVDSHETPIERVIAEDTGLTLFGTVDRIDTGTDAAGNCTLALIDYKTEHPDKTRARLSSNSEDTQLPFYAAIHAPRRRGSDANVEASYLNLGSRPDSKAKGRLTQTMTLAAVGEQAEHLVTQIVHDWERLQAGTAVKALGEGDVCTHCAARGLCRKAYWDL